MLKRVPKSLKIEPKNGPNLVIFGARTCPKMGPVWNIDFGRRGSMLAPFWEPFWEPFGSKFGVGFGSFFWSQFGGAKKSARGVRNALGGGFFGPQIAPRNRLKSIYKFIYNNYNNPKNSLRYLTRPGPEARRICVFCVFLLCFDGFWLFCV